MRYIIAMDYEYDDFDADGIGDIVRRDTQYILKGSWPSVLSYLKTNIYYQDGETKPDFDTVEEYCNEFKFRVYERKLPR